MKIYCYRCGFPVGVEDGLKHESCICCDELISIAKGALTDFIGSLSMDRLSRLDDALRIELDTAASLPGSIHDLL